MNDSLDEFKLEVEYHALHRLTKLINRRLDSHSKAAADKNLTYLRELKDSLDLRFEDYERAIVEVRYILLSKPQSNPGFASQWPAKEAKWLKITERRKALSKRHDIFVKQILHLPLNNLDKLLLAADIRDIQERAELLRIAELAKLQEKFYNFISLVVIIIATLTVFVSIHYILDWRYPSSEVISSSSTMPKETVQEVEETIKIITNNDKSIFCTECECSVKVVHKTPPIPL
jgi:hypothetical protein